MKGKMAGRLAGTGLSVLAAVFMLAGAGCQKAPLPVSHAHGGADAALMAEEAWGIEIVGVRLSAEGYMLDFRYRVVDPEKAAPLHDRKLPARLVDAKSGATLIVPAPARVGQLRQAVRNGLPEPGKVYFIMFANPGRLVRHGDRVTVAVGDFAAGLVVGQ